MSSAFLVFDLIRRNASPERSVTPEVSSIQNLMTVKKRSGLSSEKRVSGVPAGKDSPKGTERAGGEKNFVGKNTRNFFKQCDRLSFSNQSKKKKLRTTHSLVYRY